jgi:hypothetical protein
VSELEEIQKKAEEFNLEFLLIGGLAVIEHGLRGLRRMSIFSFAKDKLIPGIGSCSIWDTNSSMMGAAFNNLNDLLLPHGRSI